MERLTLSMATELTDLTYVLYHITKRISSAVNICERKTAAKAISKELGNQRKGFMLGDDLAAALASLVKHGVIGEHGKAATMGTEAASSGPQLIED